ncbi:phage major capsid protein [Tautonia plasticadhaerens]|uniref:Phage capsid family protein n=1 Tax=Tautonia plasticadhaerens TaxID=2527974 RepID=A0A518GZL3_9BACT|nr:phage major capsid protein [Tautonia plasticadhaerens]QDV34024.1 Phage capsid family protein [Tautonia plasticadhaerens]
MPTSVELREERAGLVKQARDLQAAADAEGRDLSAEETEQFDRVMADVDAMRSQVDRMEKLEAVESDLDRPVERQAEGIDSERREHRRGEQRAEAREAEERAAFAHFLRTGEVRQSLRAGEERHAGLMAEVRDTIIGTDAKGGYLITPTRVTQQLVKVVDDMVFMRRLATVHTVNDAKKLGIRTLPTHMADASWTTEVAAVTEDTTMAFGRRDLEPYLLSKLSKVSLRTLALSSDAESIVRQELGYKFGLTQEKAFLTADGSSKPLGVFTASASGISTGRDVAGSNTTTAIVADTLFDVVYAVNPGYLVGDKVGWIFHRDAVKAIRKLKDSDNQYLWQPGLQAGQPDQLLRFPVYQSEHAPNTFTAGLYVGLFGNFSYYHIAEVNAFAIQRLTELYAATNEVGFIGRIWVDGAPVLESAFARMKLAAS